MAQTYQHGVYAPLDASEDFTPPQSAGTLPLYIGTAPVHQLASPPKAGEPILIRTWREMESLLGYSDDWASFDLCEACYAHLRSRVGSVAPIAVINLVDPAKHKSEGKTIQATFTAGRAVVAAPLAIRSTVKIASKAEGTDFSVSYSADGKSLILEDLTGSLTTETVNYNEVDVSKITASDVVKAINSQVPLVYQKLGLVPTILCCPRLGNEEGVYDALTAMAASIGGHWHAFVSAGLEAGSREEALSQRDAAGLDSSLSNACWPMAKWNGKVFHLSVLAAAGMQRVDAANGNIPCESPSNKPIDCDGLCLADGTPVDLIEEDANGLNAKGITTAVYRGGRFVLWGPHTAAYRFGKDMDFRDRFDATVRMAQYVANSFQLHNGSRIDATMRRSLVDTILNDFQAFLDQLRADGRILGGSIRFDESSNPESDMVTGDFVFDVKVSPGIPAKSITGRVRCTTEGLTTLFGGDQNA